jgi:hypothetical protein
MDFTAAHTAVETLLKEEAPEGSMHAMHIRSKQAALATITREADLGPDTEVSSRPFDTHHEVSKLIRSFMKNGK